MMQYRSPFLDFLEERPEIAYFSQLQERGYDAPKRRQLRGLFDDFQSEYLGRLGSQVRQGIAPTLRFDDFLSNIDFDQYQKSLLPSERGRGLFSSRFAPRVRHLLHY